LAYGIQLQILNSEFTQDNLGERVMKFDVQYNINDFTNSGLAVDLYVQFSTIGGTVTNLLKNPETLSTIKSEGKFPYQVSGLETLPDNVMRIAVFMWRRDTQTPVAYNVNKELTLLTAPIIDTGSTPSASWSNIQFSSDFKYENFDISGTISIKKTENFNPIYNNTPLRLIYQIKNSNGTSLILNEQPFTFNNLSLIDFGINQQLEDTQTNRQVTFEAFVWDSANIPYSSVGKMQFSLGEIIIEPPSFPIESDGLVRMIRLTGTDKDYEIRVQPENVESYIDRGIARLLTQNEYDNLPILPTPTPDPTPDPTFCVNVYTLDEGGNVLSNHYDNISLSNLQTLQNENKFIFLCEDGIIPTENQVREFYGYVAPIEDSSINTTMISQSIGSFTLVDGIVKGEILYIANSEFNPFYYNKSISSLVQIKSKSGVPLVVKENVLNFTETERDERIQIDEGIGNFKEIVIEFYVWKSTTDLRQFTETKQIQVVEDDPTLTCPIGYHKDFTGKCVPDDPIGETPPDKLINTLKGFLFGTVALSLLARKY
tara:strand:+ start:510 stop:2135 length:1626 start_codon:yes stop_codon:yes gene_type:complete